MKRLLLVCLTVLLSVFFACENKNPDAKTDSADTLNTKNVPPADVSTVNICLIKDVSTAGSAPSEIIVDFLHEFTQNELDTLSIKDVGKKTVFELPSGKSFLNLYDDISSLGISDSMKIVMQTFSHDTDGNFKINEQVSFKLFSDSFKLNKKRWEIVPFRVFVTNNKITLLEEIYIP